MIIPCDTCGKEFYKQPCLVKRFQFHYCSRRCYLDPRARFWSKVNKTGECWIWAGATKNGYGKCLWGGKHIQAHRAAWEFTNGPIPNGLCVCHNCPGGDNPSCVNPAHLFLGTPQENFQDAVKKGAFPKGEKAFSSKLTEAKVKQIRKLYVPWNRKVSTRQLARRFGVSGPVLWKVVKMKTWKHV